jgi:Transposase DDE domain.
VALRRHVEPLEKATAERFKAGPDRGKLRRFTQFYDAAQSWAGSSASSPGSSGPEGSRYPLHRHQPGRRPRQALYERLYCARGQAENHIKAWKNHLAADRTSCHAAEANQFRLFLHAGAYWLLWSMRRVMPKHSVGGSCNSTLCGCA